MTTGNGVPGAAVREGGAVKMLTERQAWTLIAEAFACYEATGTREELTTSGLCHAVSRLRGREMIGPVAFNKMWQKLSDVMDESSRVYPYPRTRRGAGLRAMLATLFAEDSAV